MRKKESVQPNVRWIVWVLLAANFLFSAFVYLQSSSSKKPPIVYVDALKLISKYKGTEGARNEIISRNQSNNTNLDTLRNELEFLLKEYEEVKISNKPSRKLELEAQIQAKQKQFMAYEQIVKENAYKADQEVSLKILNKVNDYIKRYGEKHGYPIILAATNIGNIAYGDKSLDITEEILKGLNEEFAKGK